MKPLFVLFSVFAVTLMVNKFIYGSFNIQLSARISMCAMLIFTAIGHFVFTKGMVMMMPKFIPYKVGLVHLTGVLEIILGVALIFPSTKVFSAWMLIVFFLLILPANIKASIEHIDIQKATFTGNGLSYLWFRIPLQALFIVWIYLSAIRY